MTFLNERQAKNQRKIHAKQASNEGLLPRNIKRIPTTQESEQSKLLKIWADITSKKYKELINTWNDAQHD